MSDQHSSPATATAAHTGTEHDGGHGHAAGTPAPANPFAPEEITQFEQDDILAGSHIGKMLALLFIYTVIAMSLVSWWTWSVTQ